MSDSKVISYIDPQPASDLDNDSFMEKRSYPVSPPPEYVHDGQVPKEVNSGRERSRLTQTLLYMSVFTLPGLMFCPSHRRRVFGTTNSGRGGCCRRSKQAQAQQSIVA